MNSFYFRNCPASVGVLAAGVNQSSHGGARLRASRRVSDPGSIIQTRVLSRAWYRIVGLVVSVSSFSLDPTFILTLEICMAIIKAGIVLFRERGSSEKKIGSQFL